MAFVFGPRKQCTDDEYGGGETESSEAVRETRLHFASKQLSQDIFHLGVTLGSGSFGRVRLVSYSGAGNSTGTEPQYFALKILKKDKVLKAGQVTHTLDEKNVLAKIRHPFIVNLYAAFQDFKTLYMLMEFVCGGELFSQLQRCNRFEDPVARFYASEVVLAFSYIHSLNIVYRDLKPENLLIDGEGHIKITDFGFAKVVLDRSYTLCGTPEYLAPETIVNRGHSFGVDWWAVGILIYEMLAGYPPFFDDNPVNVYKKIIGGKYEYPSHFKNDAKSIIDSLLEADVTKRLGCMKNRAEDIKNHKWFKGVDWKATLNRKVAPPFVPKMRGPSDTANFDEYPDSAGHVGGLSQEEMDLFADF